MKELTTWDHLHLILDVWPIPKESVDDLDIPLGGGQTDTHTHKHLRTDKWTSKSVLIDSIVWGSLSLIDVGEV